MSASGWIGVDLDGTLAHFDIWRGPGHIGEPVPAMLERVKAWIADGQEVRIFTARASVWELEPEGAMKDALFREFVDPVARWRIRHLGVPLQVTSIKDFTCNETWDDRAVRVEMNTGRVIGGME